MLSLLGGAVAGCAAAPKSPMEVRLNRAAGARIAAEQCPAYGGYASAQKMLSDASKNAAEAKRLGATKEDYEKAKKNVNGAFMTTVFMVGQPAACNSIINQLAIGGTKSPEHSDEF
ncbi:hypothetical protein E1162_06235 [Rhodobacteraceae bacterium RKSG542]|nr:hypothetical protein [Pseudovibrio flavus]MTI16832.1 hypothetical protein [Pseudovibrio flavus]